MSDRPRCKKVQRNGEQCPRHAVEDSDYCAAHDPSKSAERGRKGGEVKAERARQKRAEEAAAIRIGTVASIQSVLGSAIVSAYQHGRWNEVISGCRVAIELIKSGTFEERLAEIEKELAEKKSQEDPWPTY